MTTLAAPAAVRLLARRTGPATLAPSAWLVVAAGLALALALRLPVATVVLGLAAFGVLHNVLELRYVAGRFDAVLTGPFLGLLIALVTGVAICRLLPVGAASRAAEIALSYVLLGVACARALSARTVWLAGALGVLVLAAAASFTFPAYHFVVLSHLHNVVPLFFCGSGRGPCRGGGVGCSGPSTVGWVLGVPALILAGVFDPLVRAAPAALGGFGGVTAFEVPALVHTYAPPALVPTGMGVRFLVVFAFMQTMHYVVWIGVLPRYAPQAAARFDARVPEVRGRRTWLLGIGLAAVLGVLFGLDYASGRTLYAAAASYHAYLEFPVLLALIFAVRPSKPGDCPMNLADVAPAASSGGGYFIAVLAAGLCCLLLASGVILAIVLFRRSRRS